jgi:hypothetical protein
VIVLVALAVVVLSVPLAGGHLAGLTSIRLRAVWVVVVAVALQIAVVNVFERVLPHGVAATAHVASYALAAMFLVANLRIRGLWIVALGAALNMAAILANGGVMPASPSAYARAGHGPPTDRFVNSVATEHARLAFLGDVFALPEGYPFANVFSVGDIVLVAGAGVVLHCAAGSRLVRARPLPVP